MLNAIIRFSLRNRFLILLIGIVTLVYGGWVASKLSVDVFPDLNKPTVSILTEAHGLAPEEVETLVTLPIETALNGTPGLTRLRSSSGIGISIIYVEFEWNTDTYRNRQLVFEKLQLIRDRLPKDIVPTLGPISSIMGEIQFVGVSSPDEKLSPMELRTLADWTIRPRLMMIPGISQVIVMGGEVTQYQILVSSDRLQHKGISIETLKHALSEISGNTTGGFLDIQGKEYLIRPLGRVESIEQIENSFVGLHLGRPVLVKDIAEVKTGPRVKRGEGSINGQHAVVMTIQKQPTANTVELTQQIDKELVELRKVLPAGVKLDGDLFKQSRFIEASISNVKEALLLGATIVAIILFAFLLNFRTTGITLITIPISLLITAIVFRWMGLSINTMTLGGLAIAIGELVDDSIVDVENVFRRLRENKLLKSPKNPLKVVFEASSEVRNSIVFSTAIVVLVFIPLFALGGIEGRLFAPLGVAYIISLIASLVVSLTLTPVLCSFLLPEATAMEKEESFIVQKLKTWDTKVLKKTIHHPYVVLGCCAILLLGSLLLLPLMGRSFLPDFNEGTATIGIALNPGISLEESDRIGTEMEKAMLKIPEVKTTTRRTGRAEMDEHAEGVHWNEVDVDFKEGGRPRSVVLNELRDHLERVARVDINIGQPISHRLDHLLSGVRAQIAVKLFGPDLSELRRIGAQIQSVLKNIHGIVDLNLEPLVLIPQLKMAIDRDEAARYGILAGAFAQDLETALNGEAVGQMIQQQKIFDVFMRFDSESRNNPEKIKSAIIKIMPTGQHVKVQDVAEVYTGTGPNMVNREDVQRRIIVSANSEGRDLGRLVEEIKTKLKDEVKLPQGYFIKLGGQFESQQQASRMLLFLGGLSLIGIFLILFIHFRSIAITLQIMLNVPMALIGGIVGIYLTEGVLSVATLIAFITLCGIATRNGIMMISHYLHLVQEEGERFGEKMVIRGSLERLIPVLMTASAAALALLPLLFSKGEPGKEILYPVAVVIIGGLISSTLLDIIVTPTLFLRFGKKSMQRLISIQASQKQEELI